MQKASSTYSPSQDDVFAVRCLLLQFLPAELAVAIVELAEYWPVVSSTREALSGPAAVSSCVDEWCYVLSPPIPTYPGLTVKPRRITFYLEAVEECTYDSICSDYTVFQAAIIKPADITQNIMLDPIEDYPERQIHSWDVSDPRRWVIEDMQESWPEGTKQEFVCDQHRAVEEEDPLLHSLASGDRVAVMVRGLIPGWMNCIYNITTEIHYAI